MKLYWVTTEDHEEDWFVVAISAKEAAKFHEDFGPRRRSRHAGDSLLFDGGRQAKSAIIPAIQ